MKDLLRISDLDEGDVIGLLRAAMVARDDPHGQHLALRDETAVLCFDHPTARERLAFSSAVTRLGGVAAEVAGPTGDEGTPEDLGALFGDVASVVVTHLADDAVVGRLAQAAPVPVVNAGSGTHAPVTALAVLLALEDGFGSLGRVQLAYVGPATAVLNSLIEAAAVTGMDIAVATPTGTGPDRRVAEAASEVAARRRTVIELGHDPHLAVAGAHAVCTAPWTGPFDVLTGAERSALAGYAVDASLLSLTDPNCVFLPIQPVRPGREVDAEILERRRWNRGALDASLTCVAQAVLWSLVEGRLGGRAARAPRRLFAINGG